MKVDDPNRFEIKIRILDKFKAKTLKFAISGTNSKQRLIEKAQEAIEDIKKL